MPTLPAAAEGVTGCGARRAGERAAGQAAARATQGPQGLEAPKGARRPGRRRSAILAAPPPLPPPVAPLAKSSAGPRDSEALLTHSRRCGRTRRLI